MKTLVETSFFDLFASYINGAGPAAGELPAAYNDFVDRLATFIGRRPRGTTTAAELHKNRTGLHAAGLQRNGCRLPQYPV